MVVPYDGTRFVADDVPAEDEPQIKIEVLAAGRGSPGAERRIESAQLEGDATAEDRVGPRANRAGRVRIDRDAAVRLRAAIGAAPEALAKPGELLEQELMVGLELERQDEARDAVDIVALESLHKAPHPAGVEHSVVVYECDELAPGGHDALVARARETGPRLFGIAHFPHGAEGRGEHPSR